MKKQLLFILLLVAGVGTALYYFLGGNGALFGPTSTEEAMMAEMVADCPYDKDFCAYAVAQAAAMKKGVIIESSTQVGEAGQSTSQMKMDGASNIETSTYLNGELQSSMVVYAGQTYIKDLTDGAFYVVSTSPEESMDGEQTAMPTDMPYDVGNMQEVDMSMKVNKIATEACGGLTCHKYELLDENTQYPDTHLYLWIDTDENLARRMETVSPEGTFVMTYTYEEISITRPSPLKEMPTLSFPNNAGSGEMPSEDEIKQMMMEYGLDG